VQFQFGRPLHPASQAIAGIGSIAYPNAYSPHVTARHEVNVQARLVDPSA
jgi:hypothetical protein